MSLAPDSTYTGVISSEVVELAKDFLQGYDGDYAFYCTAPNTWWIVRFKDYELQNPPFGYNLFDSIVTQIEYQEEDTNMGVPEDWHFHTYYHQLVYFNNQDEQLCYSSLPGFPRLQEGVAHYAFGIFALLIGVCAFRLLRRILWFAG